MIYRKVWILIFAVGAAGGLLWLLSGRITSILVAQNKHSSSNTQTQSTAVLLAASSLPQQTNASTAQPISIPQQTTLSLRAIEPPTLVASTSQLISGSEQVQKSTSTSTGFGPFHFSTQPANGKEFILSYLGHRGSAWALNLMKTGHVDVKPPIPVYQITYDTMTHNQGVEAARLTMSNNTGEYIYYPEVNGQEILEIEVTLDSDANVVKWTKVGVFLTGAGVGITQILNKVSALDVVRGGSYDVRVLRMGGLNGNFYMLLWLKSDPSGLDLLYFLGPTPRGSGLQPQTLYTTVDVVQALQPRTQ